MERYTIDDDNEYYDNNNDERQADSLDDFQTYLHPPNEDELIEEILNDSKRELLECQATVNRSFNLDTTVDHSNDSNTRADLLSENLVPHIGNDQSADTNSLSNSTDDIQDNLEISEINGHSMVEKCTSNDGKNVEKSFTASNMTISPLQQPRTNLHLDISPILDVAPVHSNTRARSVTNDSNTVQEDAAESLETVSSNSTVCSPVFIVESSNISSENRRLSASSTSTGSSESISRRWVF